MGSLLKSTFNTRQLIAGSFRYVRSDVPDRITEEEKRWLLEKDVRTAVDLRSPQERQARPCPLEGDERFSYHAMPVTTGDLVPHCFEDVPRGYLDMVDGQMLRIVQFLEKAEGNVLYFCNAGKDRTGVVSALLLRRMGFSREEIIRDYVRSADNLREMLKDFVSGRPDLDLQVVTPRAWTMEQFLDQVIFP